MNAFFVYICESMENKFYIGSCKDKGRKKKKKKKAHKTHLVLTTYINNFKIHVMAFQVDIKKFITFDLTLVDSVTNQVVPATWTNIIYTSSDPSIFTADTDVNGGGKPTIVGVSEGAAGLNIKAKASYINSNGISVVDEDKETNQTINVVVPPQNLTEIVPVASPQQPVP